MSVFVCISHPEVTFKRKIEIEGDVEKGWNQIIATVFSFASVMFCSPSYKTILIVTVPFRRTHVIYFVQYQEEPKEIGE